MFPYFYEVWFLQIQSFECRCFSTNKANKSRSCSPAAHLRVVKAVVCRRCARHSCVFFLFMLCFLFHCCCSIRFQDETAGRGNCNCMNQKPEWCCTVGHHVEDGDSCWFFILFLKKKTIILTHVILFLFICFVFFFFCICCFSQLLRRPISALSWKSGSVFA